MKKFLLAAVVFLILSFGVWLIRTGLTKEEREKKLEEQTGWTRVDILRQHTSPYNFIDEIILLISPEGEEYLVVADDRAIAIVKR